MRCIASDARDALDAGAALHSFVYIWFPLGNCAFALLLLLLRLLVPVHDRTDKWSRRATPPAHSVFSGRTRRVRSCLEGVVELL